MPILKRPVHPNEPRFRNRVLDRLILDKNGCWVWGGATDKGGYGVITWDGHGDIWATHRLVWIAYNGPIPDGLEIDHWCRNHACANPFDVENHMNLTTQAENLRRRDAAKTHCYGGGHLWIPDNIVVAKKTGWKSCRLCRNERAVERRKVLVRG
jgi:hypothetical protein